MKHPYTKFKIALVAIVCPLLLILYSCSGNKKVIQQATAEDYYQTAKQQIARGDYEDAKLSLQEARKRYRTGDLDAKMMAALGDVHYQMKEYDEAIEIYREFIRLHPRHSLAPKIQYQIGMSCFQKVRPKDRDPLPAREAIEEFNKVQQYYPRSPEARYAEERVNVCRTTLAERELFVAKFYLKKKNYRGAISRLEGLLNDYSDIGLQEEALYYLGEAHRRLEDDEKAQEYFLLLLERFPGSRFNDDVRDFLEEREG
jgi:outer membrane protein assembly factor BamD